MREAGDFLLAAAVARGEAVGEGEEAHNPKPEVSREKLCCCCCCDCDSSKKDVLGDFRKGRPSNSRSRGEVANPLIAAAGGEDG